MKDPPCPPYPQYKSGILSQSKKRNLVELTPSIVKPIHEKMLENPSVLESWKPKMEEYFKQLKREAAAARKRKRENSKSNPGPFAKKQAAAAAAPTVRSVKQSSSQTEIEKLRHQLRLALQLVASMAED